LTNEQLKAVMFWYNNGFQSYIGDEFLTISENNVKIEQLDIESEQFDFIRLYGNPCNILENIFEFSKSGFFEADYVFVNEEKEDEWW
ncbi:hypothetical protein OAA60_05705, partial [Porticoccaceae bacterium]|nr:hypothetical protein [Porticoccaceae bacterium]